MHLSIVRNEQETGGVAAAAFIEAISGIPRPVVGFATGSSPLPLYRALASSVDAGELDLAEATGFALDEYVGLAPDHPQSYAKFLRHEAADPLGMQPGAIRVPNGMAADLDAECNRYERAIASAGGVDVQIVGIGANGHIGFNEPGSSFSSRTRVATLTQETRADNSRFFERIEDVPERCITQGLATISSARHVLLVVSGEHKSEALARALYGPVTPDWPASLLQNHPAVTIVADRAAASQLAVYSSGSRVG